MQSFLSNVFTAWGLTFAAHQVRMDLTGYAIELAKVFLIAVLTRSYGCTINDVCDYEYDRNVERCKSRPLPSGKISYRSACIFAFGQLLLCLAVSYSLLSRSGSEILNSISGVKSS
jgi:4-hydroxybenzoate polyprenyltransferase